MTPVRCQKVGLGRRFDAFGDDFKPEIAAHDNDRAHDRGVLARGLRPDLLDEAAINLDPCKRVTRQIAERGITGAEIVKGDADPFGTQLLQWRQRSFLASKRNVFCDFELKGFRRQTALRQCSLNVLEQRPIAELGGEQIHSDTNGGQTFGPP